ncbi:MAG: hypothetical protein F7C35_03215 [Desulfurococcales archaeon]|nr:hypothetical protein [Desulfurococcales archaeon]
MEASLGTRVVEEAASYAPIKLIASIIVAAIFLKLFKDSLTHPGRKAEGYNMRSTIAPVLAQYYASKLWGMSGNLLLAAVLVAHALIFTILALHTPVFASIVYSIVMFGRPAQSLAGAIDYVHSHFSEPAAWIGIISALLVAFVIGVELGTHPTVKRIQFVLPILTLLTLLTGSLAVLGVIPVTFHAVLGYLTVAYLLSTRRGLHWLQALIIWVSWRRGPGITQPFAPRKS